VDTARLRRQVIEAVAGPGGEAESEGVITEPGGGRRIRRLSRQAGVTGIVRLPEAMNLLHGITRRLDVIEERLAAIETRLGLAGAADADAAHAGAGGVGGAGSAEGSAGEGSAGEGSAGEGSGSEAEAGG
jgi:hypothetical protein